MNTQEKNALFLKYKSIKLKKKKRKEKHFRIRFNERGILYYVNIEI